MEQIKRAYRDDEVIKQEEFVISEEGVKIEYLTFPKLTKTGIVRHLFTTRLGGTSEGIFATMNLNFDRGDDDSNVRKNYERIGRILGVGVEDMVLSMQTHTTNIKRVGRADAGKGITRTRDYTDVDGLITNEPGIALVTSYADCVPVYFVDTGNRAIGLAHSGWRGTVCCMGECMVRAMGREFGSKPGEIIAAIGPSICQDCYEVSEEVADKFYKLFENDGQIEQEIFDSGYKNGYGHEKRHVVIPGKEKGKFMLDLWLANMIILVKAGIRLDNIAVTDICTCHNPDYLFSHRASMGKRGNLSAFLMLT